MPGFVERNGIKHFKELANKLIADLVRFGFVIKYTDSGDTTFTPYSAENETGDPITVAYTTTATLEVGPTVDPLATGAPLTLDTNPSKIVAQPWRIRIDAKNSAVKSNDPGYLRIYIAHPYQLPDAESGKGDKVAVEFKGTGADATSQKFSRRSGELTCGYISTVNKLWGGGLGMETTINTVPIPFLSCRFSEDVGASNDETGWNYGDISAHPYSYMLSVSDRGVAFVCWMEAQDDYGDKFSWFVVQRPVDPRTGQVLAKENGKNPVFCIYSIGGGKPTDTEAVSKTAERVATDVYNNVQSATSPYLPPKIYRFTVCESDVFRPTTPVLATIDSPDNRAVINAKQQVAISENGQYVVYYPNGFNTDRFMYREEFDMLVYTSADVISQWQEVTLNPYPNAPVSIPRVYKACQANITNNRGMRILIMVDGAGIVRPLHERDWHNPPLATV